jgi:hydrogenase nickel incorporation protein HypA/HybF
MHEAAIADALLEQVRTLVPQGTRVRSVKIEVGGLEHLDSLVLDAAWSGLTDGGPLAGTKLEVQRTPVRVRCRACEQESQPEDPAILTCRSCGAVRPEVIEGSGILLRSLEVEEKE